MKQRESKRFIIIIQAVLSPILFGAILFSVYGAIACKSNIILIAVSILSSVICIKSNNQRDFYKHVVSRAVICLILGFCLVGNSLFCYPLGKRISFFNLLRYILMSASCWPITVAVSIFSNSEAVKRIIVKDAPASSRGQRIHLVIYFVTPIIIGIISMIALNPCIVSYDAFEVIAEAKALTPVQDYAGVLYVLWFRFLLSIIDSVAFVCIIQIIIYSLTFSFFLFEIERKYKFKFPVLLSIWLIFNILPNNIMMLITLSKDVYYAIFLCLMLMALIRMRSGQCCLKDFVFMGMSMLLVWSIRQSGIVAVVEIILLGCVLVSQKKAFIITSLIAAIASILFNMGLVQITNAEPVPGGMKYVALYQDILGVYYAGGDLSDQALNLVDKGVGEKPEFKDKYTPYWAYYDDYYPELEDEEASDFIKCYISTFLRNPGTMLQAILCRLDMLWDIHPGINAVESWQWIVENKGGNWTYLVRERDRNFLTDLYNAVGEASKDYPFKGIIWRVAIWNIMFILLLGQVKEKNAHISYLPFYGFVIAYAVSLGWSHYRYYWADELLMLMSCFLIMADSLNEKKAFEINEPI